MSLASEIQYTTICNVYEKIFKAHGRKKVEELRKFMNESRQKAGDVKNHDPEADVSLFPIMRLFLPADDRERGAYGLKEKSLADMFVRIFCVGKNSSDAKKLGNYKAADKGGSGMGDFADNVYWVVKGRFPDKNCTLTVEEINVALDEVCRLNANNESKLAEMSSLVSRLGPFELKWLTRTILKDLKLGMGFKKVFEAYHPDAEKLFANKSNLREVCDTLTDLNHRIEKDTSNIVVLSPFKPMLLERCKIEDVGKFFIDDQSYFVQTKHDGERSQIHMKDGKFKYYTRHGTDITNNWAYGETSTSDGYLTKKIANLLNTNCRSIILDGELMGWNEDRKKLSSKAMPFDVKKLTANSRHRPCFVAFDIVMYNDEILVDVPYKDRLKFLDSAFREEHGVLVRSTVSTVSTSDQLLKVFNQSMDTREEGIVLKKSDGLYKTNTREGSGCYKIKAEYSDNLIQDIDLIILGGYYGEGKYAGKFNTFLMGVSVATNGNDDSKNFYSVVTVGTGLSIEKLRELEMKFKPHWTKERPHNVVGPKKHPPDVWIDPKKSLILQLRATELTRCSLHPAGYTLRFPRVVKVRDDKPCEDAWTLAELLAMVKDGGFVQKATKRHATSSDVRETLISKMPRNVRPAPMRIDKKYLVVDSSDVFRITRLFHGKEFCVINGEENLSKNEKLTKHAVESILRTHAAKIVQNPGEETFAVIAGNPYTERVKNVANTRKWNVVKLDWLLRATEKSNWHRIADWYPWEVISTTEATEKLLADRFDEFEDSFTNDADDKSLRHSMNLAKELIENSDLALEDYDEVESEIYENGISPFSLFRNVVGHFDDPSDCTVHEFTFMRGTVKPTIDKTVTHVFVNVSAPWMDIYAKIGEFGSPRTKIVSNRWIHDSFKNQRLFSDDDYIVA